MKYVQDMYIENYKPLPIEIKRDIMNQEICLCSWLKSIDVNFPQVDQQV